MLDGNAKSCRRTEWRGPSLARGPQEGFLEDMAFELVLDGNHNLVFQRGMQCKWKKKASAEAGK